MRILAIRGENLASLAQRFEVELAQGPLAGVGLFAIVGPVGAGKSTLLDALCLALFDRTPRLAGHGGVLVRDDTVPEGDWLRSSDPRTLLRREAGHGFAEVDFSGRDGVRYRARWTVRRARRRADGRVQNTELSLHDLDRDVAVASGSKTDVLAAIRLRLGLDFRQFCRSVLLAQGDFAAFLLASPDERARLLENLTGAGIYRRLSMAAHERRKRHQVQVEALRAQLAVQELLDDGVRAALEARAGDLAAEHGHCMIGVDLATRYVSWHAAASKQREDESQATVALQRAVAALTGAGARRERHESMQRALPLALHLRLVRQRTAEHAELMAKAAAAARRLAESQADAADAGTALADALLAFGGGGQAPRAVPAVVREFPRWRSSAQQFLEVAQAAARLEAAVPGLRQAEQAAAAALPPAAARVVALLAAQAEAAGHLEAGRTAASDARFADLPARRRLHARRVGEQRARAEQLRAWAEAVQQAAAARELAAAAAGGVPPLAAGFPELVAARAAAGDQRTAARRVCDRIRASMGLQGMRERLVAGEPCPLCGAREHPAGGGHSPAELAAAEQAVASAEAAFEAAHEAVLAREAEQRQAERERARTAEAADAAERRAVDAGRRFRESVAEARDLAAAADPAGAEAVLLANARALDGEEAVLHLLGEQAATAMAALARAMQRAQAADAALAAAKAQEHAARTSHEQAAALVAEAGRALDRARAVGDAHAAALDASFGELVEWRAALLRRGPAALAALEDLHGRWTRAEQLGAAAAAAVTGHEASAAAARRADEAMQAAIADLEQAVRSARVTREDVLAAERLGAEAIALEGDALAALQRQVDHQRTVLQERVEQRKRHEQHDRPELDEADAKAALDLALRRREQVAGQLAEVRGQLHADDLVRRHRAELAPRLAAAEAGFEVWAALDGLIGSSDGAAFAVFAQGLTLDLLLAEANRRLAEIARRYRLERNHGGEMDFVVVDLDLAGARRSLQTLSGGETFLVSLSLALALATLAAPRSRVETLFLDEGFGTLDAQHLEQALGALDTLQAAGCQVGIISHVEGIAERIGACVDVEPQGGGQSRVRARAR